MTHTLKIIYFRERLAWDFGDDRFCACGYQNMLGGVCLVAHFDFMRPSKHCMALDVFHSILK